MTTATLKIKIDGKDAERDLKRIDDSLNRLDQKATSSKEKMKNFGSNAKKAFAVAGVAAAALGAATVKVINDLDLIGKTADKVGLSTTALQELRHAAELTGVSTTALDTGMQRFARRSAEAAQGTGTLSKVFDELGISATNADGSLKGTEELLNEFGDELGKVTSESDRLRLSMAAFDTEGAAIGRIFVDGAAGADKLRSSMENVIPEQAIRDAEAANDALTNLTTSTSNLASGIIAKLAPAITTTARFLQNLPQYFNAASLAISDFFFAIREGIVAMVDFGKAAIKMSKDAVKAVKDMASAIGDYMGSQITSVLDGVKDKTEAVSDWFFQMYDKVVGHSYVPDMVDEIGYSFDRLDIVMVDPADEATQEVTETFKDMAENVSESFGSLIYDNIASVLSDGKLTFEDFTTTVKDMFFQMIKDMITAWTSAKFAKIFSVAFGGSGGIIGNIASSFGGSASAGIGGKIAGIFGGGASSGGAALLGPSIGGATATTGGTLSAPAIASSKEVAALTSQWTANTAAISGSTLAVGGFVTAIAGIAIYGAMNQKARDEENAKLTEQFNQLRTGTNEFAGELVAVNEHLSIVGSTADAMYVSLQGTQQERTAQLQTFSEAVGEAGGVIRQIYQEGEQSIAMITGNLEASAEVIKAGFDHAKLSFTSFKQNGINGMNQLTAKVKGSTKEWTKSLNEALESGKLSADSSFTFIEDDFGNMVLKMNGDAQAWANYLSAQGRLGVDAMAQSFKFIDDDGTQMFASLSQETLAFQRTLNSLKAPNLTASVNYSSPGGSGFSQGFANGGEFMVGGNGGTDTTPVSFMATRGERVSIQTEEQQQADSDGNVQTLILEELRLLRAQEGERVATELRRSQYNSQQVAR